jgi:hypothetical protein
MKMMVSGARTESLVAGVTWARKTAFQSRVYIRNSEVKHQRYWKSHEELSSKGRDELDGWWWDIRFPDGEMWPWYVKKHAKANGSGPDDLTAPRQDTMCI